MPSFEVVTADGMVHYPTFKGTFQDLSSYVLPHFKDILIHLSNYLSQNRITIVGSTSMQIFDKSVFLDTAIAKLHKQYVTDQVITAPVKDKIYTVPLQRFSSVPIRNTNSMTSSLPSSSISSASVYVIGNYKKAHFTSRGQLICFFP